MMTLYCDESDDGHTYALAGWLAVPSAWASFDVEWRSMLSTLRMPDGSTCRAFHAADIVGRDSIKNSPFKGWTFQDEIAAFTRATDLLCDRRVCPLLWPVGCAVEVPREFRFIQRDAIWLLLFLKLFQLVVETYRAQQSIELVFDKKPEIVPYASTVYQQALKMIAPFQPHKFEPDIRFAADESESPLQAADLLAFEWRKRISDETRRPDKPARTSFRRLRERRKDGALWRYGHAVFERALLAQDQSLEWVKLLLGERPTHMD